MSEIDVMVKNFMAQKKIAVVGVSDKRETGCNSVYKKFRAAGYTVYGVNPRISTYEGAPCYPDLKSIPDKPEAVFILANPKVTDQIVAQCVEVGVKHVWMHCMMGTKVGAGGSSTSVSPDAVKMCRDNGIAVIPGTCPNQFFKADPFHALMRKLFRGMGFLKISPV